MALFEGKTPAERNKTIAALALGLVAFLVIARLLFGSSGPARPTSNANARPTPRRTAQQQAQTGRPAEAEVPYFIPIPVVYTRPRAGGAEAGRNIFTYYAGPARPAGPATPVETPAAPATPAPTPPLVLGSVSPQSVYARTGNFQLQLAGDKFTGAVRVYVDGQEMPTQFKSPQQLTATVPASSIAAPGSRQIIVRTPDNQLYSNGSTLNVMQPPAPTHTYVGIFSRTRFDTAVLKNQKGDLLSVRVGDPVEGRFRVVAISERALELVDKDLNIKHTLPFVDARGTGVSSRGPIGAIPPPPPKPEDDAGPDEEP